ncbi:MAG: hypothetical protein ACO1OF_08290 [Adhaeribacter sp.]
MLQKIPEFLVVVISHTVLAGYNAAMRRNNKSGGNNLCVVNNRQWPVILSLSKDL